MIEYETIEIHKEEDYDEILKKVPEQFTRHIYARAWLCELKKKIGTKINLLLIEFPYYDSEYLSSYYSFYSKKFRNYGKESCRIHMLKDEKYMGYISLRPTSHHLNFSKSYLDPKLLLQNKAYLMLSEFSAHIYGIEYRVQAFPWMNQQRDFSMCAHIAAWEILKFYGNEHRGYKDITIGELVEQIKESGDRKLPSNGLNLQQIADIFRCYQMTPIILRKENDRKQEFYRSILAYVESGIPIVGAINKREHAVAVIGHGKIDLGRLECLNGLIDSSELCTSLIVNDDNQLPYSEVFYSKNGNKDKGYCIEDLDFAIVPLYNRIHLEYAVLYERVKSYLQNDFSDKYTDAVIRIYLTSASSLKRKIAEMEEMQLTLKDIILRLEMPKFIWCVDISSKEEYKIEKVSSKLIIDSTACAGDLTPWLLVQKKDEILYREGEVWNKIVEKVEPYSIYQNNLKEMEPWSGKK